VLPISLLDVKVRFFSLISNLTRLFLSILDTEYDKIKEIQEKYN